MSGLLSAVLPTVSVSRETEARFGTFLGRVAQWTSKINLVSRGSADDLVARHLVDSAQLFAHLRASDRTLADLGSGGGFPGVVIAILARELQPQLAVTLVESDRRKATFLRMVSAELDLQATVQPMRIEAVPPLGADVVSARALAPLDTLLTMADRHLAPGGTALFLKGESYRTEIATARRTWHFEVEAIGSITKDTAALLKIKDIRRA